MERMEHCVETRGFSKVSGINTMLILQPQTYLTIRYLRDHPQKINILQTGVQKIGLFSQDKLRSLNYLRILNDFSTDSESSSSEITVYLPTKR